MSRFLDGEMSGGLGTLSDGSKLASGVTATGHKQIGGRFKMYADKNSFDSFWHGVQGDLTSETLDSRTLNKNIFGFSYPGSRNPKNITVKMITLTYRQILLNIQVLPMI